MTTTSKFQVKPDFYSTPEECQNYNSINTNKRYRYFCQTHFTAGDTEQFEEYRDKTNGDEKEVIISNNNFSNDLFKNISWIKYQNLDIKSVDNTFKYIFNKFKKGIFIKIKNRKLSVFLPFSKKNFVNEWSNLIEIPNNDLLSFIEKLQKNEKRKFNPKSVNKFIDTWFSNNCLLRWEFPINEGDTNIQCTSDFFHTLVKEREIPDIEFFVNRRDFPIIKRDQTEAYDHIFGDDTKLLSHNYEKYSPILSMVGKNNYADIPIPTSEDWARVCRSEKKFFPKTEKRDYENYEIPWENKKDIAVFRGSSTGAGTTIDTNIRLRLAYLGNLPENKEYLDAGITDWTLRPRKIKGEKYLQSISIDKLPFTLIQKLSQKEQQYYKYIVNVDGHVAAYRLSMELSCGFCILLAPSEYKLWYSDLLQPYVHFIPIKKDLSDLIQKIKWCRQNDTKCREIAKNAVQFSQKYLSKNGILDYTQNLLVNLKKDIGIYLYPEDNYKKQREKYIQKLKEYKHTFTIQNKTLIFNNDHTEIYKGYHDNKIYCEKKSERDLVNEAYITIFGTNKLKKDIPNFCYTYSYDNSLINEYIPGLNLYQYIHDKSFDFFTFINILYQIALSLHVAQKRLNFVHMDLAPWNIILHKLEKRTEVQYIINENTVYHIDTDIIPIVIDMGRATINIDSKENNLNTIQDILTILNVSVYEIASHDSCDINNLIKLCNFISNTTYRKKPFFKSGKNGLGEIRYFFGKAKKYSELLESDKYELESKTPLDFIYYLNKHFDIQKRVDNIFSLSYSHPLQDDFLKLLNSIFSEDTVIQDMEKLEQFYMYREIVDKVYQNTQKYTDKYNRCKKYIDKAIKQFMKTNNNILKSNEYIYNKLRLKKFLFN